MKTITQANSGDVVAALYGYEHPLTPYEDCENGLDAARRYLKILEAERAFGLRIDKDDPDYFLDEIFAAKVALLFFESSQFADEQSAIEAMKSLDHPGLKEIAEIFEEGDYCSLEF